jgi:SAM-dependent methyltransferase
MRRELGDEDKAIAATVGGDFDVFGQIEYDLLRALGLREDYSVVDVGCGCGRLAFYLREFTRAKYTGIDVIPELVAYAKRMAGRADWDFLVGDGAAIPGDVAPADFVCFFSVLTHLSHEDGFLYLREACRVLKPGGILVFSFLDFAVHEHWTPFQGSIANRDDERVMVQYLNRDTVVSWASHLGLGVCAVIDGDRLRIPISAPLRWQGQLVQAESMALGQSVAVLSATPDRVPQAALIGLGADPGSLRAGTYRDLLRSTQESSREALARAQARIGELTGICAAGAGYIQRLRSDLEGLHRKIREVEDECAVEKGRRAALGRSWMPGRILEPRLPHDRYFRARSFGDNGADLPGPPITYYLFTPPYRMFAPGRNLVSGWCACETASITAVRVRLDRREFAGVFGADTKSIAGAEPDGFAESRKDGFVVDFEIPAAGRHFLRIEACVAGGGWSTFVSCPIWTSGA